ncbi:MAG: DUF1048 domain-containing protein [Eubacteriales bacterium]|nr:DUF1048 domain-containing protein [Eubacteriales bacterium]
MTIRDIINDKKQWQAHMDRVNVLPQDYQTVYREIKKYVFNAGPVDSAEGMRLLFGIVDLFEEGSALGKGVLEVTGNDVAAFCDDLMKDSKTFADVYDE